MSTVSSSIDAAEAQKLLDKHNCARRRYGLQPLVWDWKLAAHAQEHADRCIWNHASILGIGVPGEGENLSLAMGKPVDVDGWLAEEPYYDCVNGKCRPPSADKMCGHWTQVMWRDTGRVGCGKRRCATLQSAPGFLNSDILVCRYTPPGNYVGQRMVAQEQCATGAANRNCSNDSTSTVTPNATIPKPTPAETTQYIDKEKAADSSRDLSQPVSRSEGNLNRVNINQDKFSSEQDRINNLRAAAGLPSNNYDNNALPLPDGNPDYVAEPSDIYLSNLHKVAPQTVVFADTSNGYPNAEQTAADQKSFTIGIIITVSLILILVLVAIAYFSYHYREGLRRWGNSVYDKLNKRLF